MQRRKAGPLGQISTSWVSSQLYLCSESLPSRPHWVGQSGHHLVIMTFSLSSIHYCVSLGTSWKLEDYVTRLQGHLNEQITALKRRGKSREESKSKHDTPNTDGAAAFQLRLPSPGPLAALPTRRLCWCSESSLPPGLRTQLLLTTIPGEDRNWCQEGLAAGTAAPILAWEAEKSTVSG